MFIISYILAQADSQVINNLVESEEKLEELNGRLDLIKQDYVALVDEANSYSFFNLDNIYFWFVIVGLLLLVFGLLFLWVELQHPSSQKKEIKQVSFDKPVKVEPVVKEVFVESKPVTKTSKKTKVVKIKVVKVK